MNLEDYRKFKQAYNKLYNTSNENLCFCSNKDCTKGSLKAHTIQQNPILKNLINKDGKVLELIHGNNELIFNLEGTKKATTFTGFCQYHDRFIFDPIENNHKYNSGNKEQQFLFAYRTIAHEYHSKIRHKNIIQSLLENVKSPEKHIVPEFDFTKYNSRELMLIYNESVEKLKCWEYDVRDYEFYKEMLNKSLAERNFETIHTTEMIFEGDFGFSVSSGIYLQHDFNNNLVNDIRSISSRIKPLTINIFCQNNTTYVLLSCFKIDLKHYNGFMEYLKNLNEKKQKSAISNLIVSYGETFIYSPDAWDNLDEATKIFAKKMFNYQYREPSQIPKNCNFNLFK